MLREPELTFDPETAMSNSVLMATQVTSWSCPLRTCTGRGDRPMEKPPWRRQKMPGGHLGIVRLKIMIITIMKEKHKQIERIRVRRRGENLAINVNMQ